MSKHGKNFTKAVGTFDQSQRYDVSEAVKLAVDNSFAKFDESVDVAINLGVDPKYSDQMIRGAVPLPNGLGKTVRVIVFCKPDKATEAKDAGADEAGGEELVEKIKGGWLDFDNAVATPDMMSKVGQIGRLLGPRGLMPNAKTGTVTFNVADAVRELKAGRVEFKVDKAGILHAPIGKKSFGADKLCQNLSALLEAVNRMKPATSKGTYLKSMAVATTMGPGVKVDTQTIRRFLEG